MEQPAFFRGEEGDRRCFLTDRPDGEVEGRAVYGQTDGQSDGLADVQPDVLPDGKTGGASGMTDDPAKQDASEVRSEYDRQILSDATVQKIVRYLDRAPNDVQAYADLLSVIEANLGDDVPYIRGRKAVAPTRRSRKAKTDLSDDKPTFQLAGRPDSLLVDGLPEKTAKKSGGKEESGYDITRGLVVSVQSDQDLERERRNAWHRFNRKVRALIAGLPRRLKLRDDPVGVEDAMRLFQRSLYLDSLVDLDAYMLYIESARHADRQFYLPRRKILRPIVSDLMDLHSGKLNLLTISLPPGVGKALANDTPILTRNGWKNHGDLVVGDEVIGLDGKFKKVIAVHPKCMLDCLVEFSNGETIQCHENHEWLIHDRARHISAERDYIVETKRLEKRTLNSGAEPGHRGHRYTVQLPHHGYVHGEEKDLPLDPYLLGVWLGDGANRNPRICCAEGDKSVIDRIVRNGMPIRWQTVHKTTGVLYFDFDMRRALRSMGMCHSRHITEKHIPVEYLTASVRQRLDLLAGLLDTDGTLVGSKYRFSTTAPLLRDSFIDLLSTFGWRACVKTYEPKVSSSGVHGRKECYVIGFTPDIQIPCELERKRNKEPHKQRAIGFKSITRVEPKEGNCITVEGDGMYLAGRRMLPTHNTTLALFYLTWLAGLNPDKPILTFSHDAGIIRGMYDEIIRIVSPAGEYLWSDVFPGVSLVDTNAKDLRIDLGERKRFETFQFSSTGAGNAGKLRASQLLFCDDLVEGIEQASSKERLDKLWTTYNTDIQQRKSGECSELHIATRWSVWDVIGRLERQEMDEPTGKAKFVVVPALNAEGKSNFDYEGIHDRFTTDMYLRQKENMDDVNWRAIYMNQPIEREGQLYNAEELRRFFSLPEGEPDAILAVCDTKDQGKDYAFMPIAYVYGDDVYIVDCICDNGDPMVIEERIARALVQHKVQMAQFESNSAGGRIASKIQERVAQLGGKTAISTKYTTAHKETKILVNSPYVKQHCLFLDESLYKRNSDYGRAMAMLTTYVVAGRNKHDDVPDGMAMLALYMQNIGARRVEIIRRLF